MLTVEQSLFVGLSNSQLQGAEFVPPHAGTAVAISYTQLETTTVQGSLKIQDVEFNNNGLNEKNRTLPCVIGATGFGTLDIQNSKFIENGVMCIAISSVGKNGKVNIKESLFSSNSGRAILLPAHGSSNYQTTIQSCNFENNTLTGFIGATIEIGSVAGYVFHFFYLE